MMCTHRTSTAIVQWAARKLQPGKEKAGATAQEACKLPATVIDASLCVLEHEACFDRCIRCAFDVCCALLRQRVCLRALLWEAWI